MFLSIEEEAEKGSNYENDLKNPMQRNLFGLWVSFLLTVQ